MDRIKEEERRKFLKRMLQRSFSKVKEDPKVKTLLSEREAEDGLNTVLERIIDRVLKRERELNRRLTFQEFLQCIMKTLDDLTSKTEYIV